MTNNIKDIVEKENVLNNGHHIRTFNWGGHTIADSSNEYKHAYEIGYYESLLHNTELITGSGSGIMKATLEGAQKADKEMKRKGKYYIGFSEQKISNNEKVNNSNKINTVVNKLVIFPTIEKRIEAFVRASHFGRIFTGGPGTIQEIIYFLAMKMDEKNENIYYPLHLIEAPGEDSMKKIDKYLVKCFGKDIRVNYRLIEKSPEQYIKEDFESDIKHIKKNIVWNEEIHFSPELKETFYVTPESIEKIELKKPKNQRERMELIINLKNLFSTIVYATALNPDILKEWDYIPEIKGDKDIIKATTKLIESFYKEKKLAVNNNTPKIIDWLKFIEL